jgi:hypothetical protein
LIQPIKRDDLGISVYYYDPIIFYPTDSNDLQQNLHVLVLQIFKELILFGATLMGLSLEFQMKSGIWYNAGIGFGKL